MNFNPVSLGAAPLVASAIGRSIGLKVEVSHSASTAFVRIDPTTGQKIITLPLLPVDLDEQMATVLWGLIHHEGGHCRHSDFEIFDEPELQSDRLLLSLLQALEDIRMERAHIRLYPGAARILMDLVRVLVDIGFFKPLPADADVCTAFHAFVLKHLRTTALGQQALADQSNAARSFLEEKLGPGFVTRLVAELQPILNAGSTVDALNVAYRIRQFLQEEMENQQEPPPPGGDPDANDDDSSDDSDAASATSSSNAPGDQEDQVPSDPDSSDPDDPSESNDDQGSNAPDDQPDAGPDESESSPEKLLKEILEGTDLDASLGDLGEALSDVLDKGIEKQSSRSISLPRDDRRNDGYRDASSVKKARSISSRLAIQLKRQLESYNEVVSDPALRGKRVSRRHLHRVAHKDYRVFVHREQLPEVNTAIVSLIDASGSMRGARIKIASEAILSTALALGTIPFLAHAVGAFPSKKGHDHVELVQDFPEKAELISSRFSLDHRGSTPLAEALLWAADRLLHRSEERRIIFVATDGQPDDVSTTKQILAHLRRLNIEVHGLGISTEDSHKLFDSFAVVSDVPSLPQAFLSLFQRVLRKSA
jgi:Mg-chelatase subunit ChlD